MSARNGDKARFHRLRKKKLLRRELQLKSTFAQNSVAFSSGSQARKDRSTA